MQKKSATSETKKSNIEHVLVQNLVELQKVHTHLAERIDKLSTQISELLALFEMAARSFAQQPVNKVAEKDKDFLDKVDKLLEQNKTIAKGLTLMEERIRERVYGSTAPLGMSKVENDYEPSTNSKPLPRF